MTKIFTEEKSASLTNGPCQTACRKTKVTPCLLPWTKFSSKWINDLNLRPDALTLERGEIGRYAWIYRHGKGFQTITLVVQSLRPIDKWNHTKLKNFYIAKDSEGAAYKTGKCLPRMGLIILNWAVRIVAKSCSGYNMYVYNIIP